MSGKISQIFSTSKQFVFPPSKKVQLTLEFQSTLGRVRLSKKLNFFEKVSIAISSSYGWARDQKSSRKRFSVPNSLTRRLRIFFFFSFPFSFTVSRNKDHIRKEIRLKEFDPYLVLKRRYFGCTFSWWQKFNLDWSVILVRLQNWSQSCLFNGEEKL